MSEPLAVDMKGITKRFPGVLANDQVDFSVRRGEVHALLGENGAGKTTLMNVLTGLYLQDEGQVAIQGRPVELHSPRDAIECGIGMVHQHFMLARIFSVAENIIAGLDEPRFWLNMTQVSDKIRTFAEEHRLEINPSAKIWQLSVGEQQRVEILRALYRGAEILILDEPTSVLTVQEAEELFTALRAMTAQGKSIIFISHKLDEVFAIADRVTVLRGGKLVGTVETANSDKRELARLMVGRDMVFSLDKEEMEPGETVLSMQDVHALNDYGTAALSGLSLDVRRHEIVGLAGVSGNGQRELAEVITGLRPYPKGKIIIHEEALAHRHGRWVIDKAKVRYIPEDRIHTATVPKLSLTKNVALKSYRQPPFSKNLLIDWNHTATHTDALIAEFEVKTPGNQTPAGKLSGGNLQKLILAREVASDPPLLIAVHPTYGLDVAATKFVREALLAQRKKGAGVLLISEDLEEILAISDRVAVIYEGQIMGILPAEEAQQKIDAIGLMMAGTASEES